LAKARAVSQKDIESLQEHFYTAGGILYVKKPYGHRKKTVVNQVAGWPTFNGRRQVTLGGRYYAVSRVIYLLHYGVWPVGVVDHINGDPSDNRPENLRDISHSQNNRSFITLSDKATSVFRGVSWHKTLGKWLAGIRCDGVGHNLGYYTCEKEAALAYNYKALELGFNKEALNQVFKD
jgi:hypothetical protein